MGASMLSARANETMLNPSFALNIYPDLVLVVIDPLLIYFGRTRRRQPVADSAGASTAPGRDSFL